MPLILTFAENVTGDTTLQPVLGQSGDVIGDVIDAKSTHSPQTDVGSLQHNTHKLGPG